MNEAFVQNLLIKLAFSWANMQGAKKLKKMALDPGYDLHVSLKKWFHYDIYVLMPIDKVNRTLPPKCKLIASVTIDGERFDLWVVKGQKHEGVNQ